MKEKNKIINKINTLINRNILLCSKYKINTHYEHNIKELTIILNDLLKEW